MKISNIPSAQALVKACKFYGIEHIVISPGSRNAPLTISFTKDNYFTCFSIVDERSAAFFALGMAQQLVKPVAILCTSGSALLNYYPAIAEAFYSEVPILALTADRPPYKIDVGDGQTIRQDHVFHRHIGYSANLKIDVDHATDRLQRYAPNYLQQTQEQVEDYNRQETAKAFSVLFKQKLPVHINIPFEEPLYGITTLETKDVPSISLVKPPETEVFSKDDVAYWSKSQKKMVLVGVNAPNAVEQEWIDKLAKDPSVVIFTETTSNLHHPNCFYSIDSILFPIEKSSNRTELSEMLQPDILITFGGLVVSKKIKAFLREYQPKKHWHLGGVKANDTFFCLTRHLKGNVNSLLNQLISNTKYSTSEYYPFWSLKRQAYQQKRTTYLKKIPFSDFKAFSIIFSHLNSPKQVHLSNSSTVRYAQLFPVHKDLEVYCNRGTSGIDGSSSTAVGAAVFAQKPTLLITGDLSFLYDSNAFWNHYLRKDFKVIVINNGGGGIFRILPGFDGSETFSTYFETQHKYAATHLCAHYGLEYFSAADETTLLNNIDSFLDWENSPALLEIFTPTEENNKILLDYFDFIS
ncbi:2-succinyl-5-enolpyruvyl-6-hydroxy-3-cyclohexene-1-carboxylic-acid synthase [Flavobacterium sp. ASW18X]|uniref:2-succinyl-5-enolpyruvyl-6-hydroxy-3- cyclohexene-1-carboxylic-acid synthase n=1 Tax=Flavobacterium sp. ASW18X TaxID=2572595 RepID=UPI0010AEC2E7|nr:2-succinyl-5-enolpyruvyl-6-hydroxy-3-cyclohexene-1-carboxylic-acid synthase [Flavobacterium sp. ASW18X]TKD66224.1 2-succinyl-5-enolpyruvyl-6-hydroxy-3-cyclohexene-1-carboxylic-acid synthase [Flavobacterium sp. ASW18X]